ncbi:unnamed protein product [Diatraea saccharalis]|uniref:Chitin-binding type-2 domain-containing protein n=1 Tax=Diatraea saccharalis TaxID=40085 RepID=A0A9N9QYZ2_9NEOP|nr:unnamed protein product [Diatraea saccharalis]CAG9786149.1 unnamed protein product [Diatraea saccharalis]
MTMVYASTKEERESRANKRQVKLYSGIRAAPIVCNEEGFQEDPIDCGLFHRCVKTGRDRFVSFRFQCSPGTIYDPDTEICNHPEKTRRVACGGRSNEIERNNNEISQEIPSPISTKKPMAIINQDKNIPTLKPFISNSKLVSQSTTNPVLLTKSTTTEIKNDDIYYMQSPSVNLRLTTPKSIAFINHQTTLQSGEICTSGGFMGDSENCRKFYRCVGNQRGGFIRYEFLCSDPTIWDEDKQACNHVWNVKRRRCGRGNMFENDIKSDNLTNILSTSKTDKLDKEQHPNKQIQSQINYGSKVIQTQTQISKGAVNQNQTQINYENAENVKQNQTQISYGTVISQIQSQINFGNKGTQTQLQINHSNDSSQMQSQDIKPMSTTPVATNNIPYNVSSTTMEITSNGCTESGFMGDTNDCKKFYRCVDSGKGTYIKYEFFCSEGTVWDPKVESCNHAWAVKECGVTESSFQYTNEMGNHLTTVKPSPIILSTTSSSENYYISKEPITEDNEISYGNQPSSFATGKPISSTVLSTISSTENYYISKEPITEENEISYGNQLSTSGTSKPISRLTTLSTKPDSGTKCKSTGFFGDKYDCKKFYRCVDNGNGQYIRYEFSCGEGTVWDSKIEACNHAWAVEKCGSNQNTDMEIMPTKATQVTYPLPQLTSPTSQQNDDYDTGYGSHQESTSETLTSLNTKITTEITTITTTTVSQNQYEVTKTVCKTSGFIGDPKDCKKFYRCVDNGDGSYTKYEFSCGEGTVWDAKNQVCNHAWAVKNCGENNVNDVNEIKTTTHKGFENMTSTAATTTIGTTTISSTTNQTEHQSIDNTLCQSNGFIGDNINCKKFYRCVDDGNGGYTKYEFTCGEGTVWDPEIKACNHAWSVQNCSSSGTNKYPETTTQTLDITNSQDSDNPSTQKDEYTEKPKQTTISSITSSPISDIETNIKCNVNGFFGDKKDCKKFYRCVEDGRGGFIQYEFTCSDGTVWDQSIESCNHEWVAKNCTHSESYNNITTPTFTEFSNEGQQSTEATTSTSLTSQPSSETCEKEGFYGDESNCKKFYRCVKNGQGGYTKYEFVCGDGTTWNPEIQGCDHESSDKSCKPPISTSSTKKPDSDNDELNITSFSNGTTLTPSELYTEPGKEESSEDNCKSEGFYGDSQNCKKFYRCVDNGKNGYTKYEFTCGEGTIWVQEIQACDHDNDVESCGSSHSTFKPQATTDKVQSTTQITPQSTVKENGDHSYETSTKPTSVQCTSEGFYGNQYDCTKFYRCVDNGQGSLIRYDFACGEGTAWDPNIGTCNHISEVKNCKNSNQQENHIMHEEEVLQSTESTSTTKGSTSSSESFNLNNNVCKQEGYFGDTEDCSKFYRCVDDGKGGYTKYNFDCGEGTIWDQDITTCNHPQDVNNPSCKNNGEGTSSSESTSISSSISQTTTNTEKQNTSSCEQENTNKNPESQKIKCEKAGYYANPDDCKKFYRCVDWDGNGEKFSVFHFECGEGTIWDPQLDTCNHEDSVYPPRNCSGQSENMGQETTTTEQMTSESTTQQATLGEQTTQQPNSSEQTTTQHSTSTSTQQTTTEQSTNQQTNTEQTTTEKTTTKQTTTEQTTTELTTTEQTTTKQTTTEQTTTEQTTTEQITTEQATTEQATTEQATTEQTTTEQTTTEQTTAEQTTTESTTTEQTQKTTTEQQTTTEQTTSTTEQNTEYQSTTSASNTAATENDSTTTTESDQGTTTEEPSNKECPDTDDDQYLYVCPTSFRRHPKYCNMFYQCTEDDNNGMKIATFTCPNNTIYDESKIQCVEENKADKKCNGQIARKYRLKRFNSYSKDPIQVDRDKHPCPNNGYHPFEKKNECSLVFLKCSQTKSGKLRGYVYQCPEGYVYWSISKRCEKRESMKYCQESSSRNWSNRWELPIERKNIAK